MSLMDALLLDEYRDPKQLWVNQRADGSKGSATINDPADGGVKADTPRQILNPISYDNRQLLIRTERPHGYSRVNPGTVVITATDTKNRSGRGPWFGVPLQITWVSEFAFTCHVTSDPEAPPDPMYTTSCPAAGGAGTLSVVAFWPVAFVPDLGSGFADYEALRIQNVVPQEYNGDVVAVVGVNASGTGGFYYRLSQVPSGATGLQGTVSKLTFRFDNALRSAPPSSLIRLGLAPPSNPFMTRGICSAFVTNVDPPADQWIYYPGVPMLDGQRIVGSGMDATTVQLGFALDPNNQTSVFGRLSSPTAMNAGEVSDLTADGAMQSQLTVPNTKGAVGIAPVTAGAVSLYGSNLRIRRVRAIHFGPQAYHESFALYISGGDVYPVHGQANNVIEDCVVERPGANNFHETTTVWPNSASGSTIRQQISANGVACVARRNYVDCKIQTPISNQVSTQPLWISNITSPPDANGRFTVDTRLPHNRDVGNLVAIAGVGQASPGIHPYNGWFPIVVRNSATSFTCQIFDIGGMTIPTPVFEQARVEVDIHGPIAYSGSGSVVEGNWVYDSMNSGYTDTGSTRDITFRYNYFSDAYTGFNQNLTDSTKDRSLSGGVPLLTGRLVEVDTSAGFQPGGADSNHYLAEGDIVEILFFDSVGRNSDPDYNGVFFVEAVVSPTRFKYRLNVDPKFGPAVAQPNAVYRAYALTKRQVIESNCVDLLPNTPLTWPNPQGCISVQGQTVLPAFPAWVLRDNVFRHTDGIPTELAGLAHLCPAIRMTGLNGGIIQTNLIDLEAPYPLQYLRTIPPPPSNPADMSNTSMSGALLRGGDFPSGGNAPDQLLDELARRIEDSLFF
ncbi:MAG: hypothetical protein HY299_02915 [Verrucomicrobia bacterium]|nr:hypothetical protein [Verrucomicrobiota bacterium]